MNKAMMMAAALPLASMAAGIGLDARLHGFKVTGVTDLPELDGRLVRMVYEKNGADLVWIDRDDDNKTFAIGFRTFPSDDTGVPHIIEHSVLCGSEKYPVKEPFVELLKSSFQTFLNAWTSSDSTMYPVCSRDDRDFRNLIDVYMDAVLHPLSVKSPLAFRQEGWHYELDSAEGELKRNGVVYSEMKGAFATPERMMHHEMNRLLFPDNCYRFVSGGDPVSIPKLTFEGYCDFYHRFYHPSNARIFLDGKVDLDAVLAQLDGFLRDYDRVAVDAEFVYQRPVANAKTVEYELAAEEDPQGKTLLLDAWVFGRYDDRERLMAMDAITDALADSNEAPLKKALLSRGLCEDVRFGVYSTAQLVATLFVKNVRKENVEEVRRVVRETLSAQVAKGLDHARLAALLDKAEFVDREKGSPSMPCGLQLFCEAYDLWLYGGNPADAFRNGERFATLRKRLAQGWFERVLAEAVLENPHHCVLTAVPSATLAEKNHAAEKAELAAVKRGWSQDDLKQVMAEMKTLKAHQEQPDRPEDVAKLPVLAVKDVPLRGPEVKIATVKENGVTVMLPHTSAKGVTHLRLFFALDDLTDDELLDVPLLALVMGDLATADHDPQALHNAVDAALGRFSTTHGVYADPGDVKGARPRFIVGVSALDSKRDEILRLVPEMLLRTSYADVKAIGDMLRQQRIGLERSMAGIGARIYARRRAAAQLSARGAVSERFSGIAQLRHLQALDADFAKNGAQVCARLAALARRIFTRGRLTVCLSDNVPVAWTRGLTSAFPEGQPGPASSRQLFPRRREGFTVAGRVSSAALASHPAEYLHSGVAEVAGRVLSLDYLWDEIRVKGGAYGGGFSVKPDGDAGWLSWNDPQPARSLGVYGNCGSALRRFAAGDAAFDRYVISTVARMEPYETAWNQLCSLSDLLLDGRTPEDRQRLRAEILRTAKRDLAGFADRLDALGDKAVCVIGGVKLLEGCTNRLDSVESITVKTR